MNLKAAIFRPKHCKDRKFIRTHGVILANNYATSCFLHLTDVNITTEPLPLDHYQGFLEITLFLFFWWDKFDKLYRERNFSSMYVRTADYHAILIKVQQTARDSSFLCCDAREKIDLNESFCTYSRGLTHWG